MPTYDTDHGWHPAPGGNRRSSATHVTITRLPSGRFAFDKGYPTLYWGGSQQPIACTIGMLPTFATHHEAAAHALAHGYVLRED